MNEAVNIDITPEQAGQLQALMEQCIEEIDAANERMDRYEAERKRLRSETHAIFKELRKMLHGKRSSASSLKFSRSVNELRRRSKDSEIFSRILRN